MQTARLCRTNLSVTVEQTFHQVQACMQLARRAHQSTNAPRLFSLVYSRSWGPAILCAVRLRGGSDTWLLA